MILLLLGAAALVLLLLSADAFAKARITSLKRLLAWVAALGGIALACLLLLSGRAFGALGAAVLFAPIVVSWWRESADGAKPANRAAAPPNSALSRAEALQILGLTEQATTDDIRAAHRRLMQAVHPDHGGSDWLASRLNAARAVLLQQ